MAAPAFSAITTAAGSGTTARPANSGGFLILGGCVYDDGSIAQGDASPPTQVGDEPWTLRSFSAQGTTDKFVGGWLWTKPAEASDPANFTWTETTSGTYLETVCIRYTHGSGDPIVDDTATGTAGRATTGNIPQLDTTVDECTIVAVKFGYDITGGADPSPYNRRALWDTVNYAWDRAAATTGTYGPTTVTFGGTDGYSIHAVAISPPAAGGITGTVAVTLDAFTSTASGTVTSPPAVVYVKEVGFVTNSTAGTTSAITVASGGVPIGDTIVIYGACDNTGSGGVATTIAVADNSNNAGTANTYTLQTAQAIADPVGASAGQQGFLVVCNVTRSIDAADTITITYGNSTTAKAINAQQFTGVNQTTPVLASTYTTQDNQTGTSSSVAATATAALQAVCALVAVEGGTADSYTEDADTTNGVWVTLTRRGSGTTTAGSTLNSVYKLVTASGAQTYNPTLGTARDHCSAILILDFQPSPVTGTTAVTLDSFTSAADGTVTGAGGSFTGTVAVTLDPFISAASGTYTPPPVTGTVAVTLGVFTPAASGTYTPPPITGTLAVTLGVFTPTASGTYTPAAITGTVAVTLGVFTPAASGTVGGAGEITGTAAVTLDPFTPAASGTSTPPAFTGTVAVTLDAFTSAASGSFTPAPVTGTAAVTLAPFTPAASGTVAGPGAINGTVAVTLAVFVPAASGTVTAPTVTGTVAVTLGPFTAAASGTVINPVTGTSVNTLNPFVSTATGTYTPPPAIGTAAITLAPFIATASGIVGTLAVFLVDRIDVWQEPSPAVYEEPVPVGWREPTPAQGAST